jgi:hypothetical protein
MSCTVEERKRVRRAARAIKEGVPIESVDVLAPNASHSDRPARELLTQGWALFLVVAAPSSSLTLAIERHAYLIQLYSMVNLAYELPDL